MVAVSGDSVLPQHGFGLDTHFNVLAESNRFLFRVYTPRLRSPIESNCWNDIYFIAPKFDRLFSSCQHELSNAVLAPPLGWPEKEAYEDVVQYMDWTTRPSSPYVSSSFNFAWAVWEAMRRYRQGVKHDVEIAIIDALALRGRAVTAMELLEKCPPEKRHPDHRKWCKYSTESQCALVYGYIPVSCVFASVPLLTILPNLPSYFLGSELPPRIDVYNNRFLEDVVLSGSKGGYRQFCTMLSARYRQLQPEIRLRDAAVGSVVLAISFLRHWLEHEASSRKEDNVAMTIALALNIAKWPNQDDNNLGDIMASIESMVRAIIDEIEVSRLQAHRQTSEAIRLHGLIDGLEQVIRELDNHPTTSPELDWSTPPSPSNTAVHSLPPSPLSLKLIIPASTPTSEASFASSPCTSPIDHYKTPETPCHPELTVRIDRLPSSESLRSSQGSSSASVSSSDETPETSVENIPVEQDLEESEQCLEMESDLFDEDNVDRVSETLHRERRTIIVPEPLTVSYLVTGFLFGAFVALCLVSNQRRVLLNNLT